MTHDRHSDAVPVPAGAVGLGFTDTASGRQRQHWRQQCHRSQEAHKYGNRARWSQSGEHAQRGEDHGQKSQGDSSCRREDHSSDAGRRVNDSEIGRGGTGAPLFVVPADQKKTV